MADRILAVDDKRIELRKFRDLVLAAIDYHLDDTSAAIKTDDFNSSVHYESLKKQTLEHYNKGRLTKLKHWFRDLIEIQIEARNLKFNTYLKNQTGYDIDIFEAYFKRVEKIIEKGKITTDNQFFDVSIMVEHLSSELTIDDGKIHILNHFLSTYEAKKSKKCG
ncbi:MAG: hypothetical protein WKF66_16550 [Pedobacter sp.]